MKLRKPFLLILALNLLLLACLCNLSLPRQPIPDRTLQANDEYEVLWTDTADSGCEFNVPLAAIPGVVFFETFTGISLSEPLGAPRVKAVDSLTGELLWQIDPQFYAAILVAQEDVLYRAVLGKSAQVTAYQADSGALLWKTELPPRTNMPVSMYFADNKLFVSTANDRYFVLNAQGEIITERNRQAQIYLEMDGILYLQGAAFKAIELASETERWQVSVDDYGFVHAPVFDAGTIFLRGRHSGLIYSIDQSTGQVNWKVKQKIYSNLFVDSKRVYFVDRDGYLVSLERESGVELSKVKFSVPFDPNTSQDVDHCITGDLANNVLVMSFYDNKQSLAVKIIRP